MTGTSANAAHARSVEEPQDNVEGYKSGGAGIEPCWFKAASSIPSIERLVGKDMFPFMEASTLVGGVAQPASIENI